MGGVFRPGSDSVSTQCPKTVTPSFDKSQVSALTVESDDVVLEHAVPSAASLGRMMVCEVTAPLPANKGVTVLLQPLLRTN